MQKLRQKLMKQQKKRAEQLLKAIRIQEGFSLQAYGWLWEQLLANQGAQLLNNENGRESAATEIGWSDEQGLSILQWVENMVNDGTFANYGTNGGNMAAGLLSW